MQKTFFILYFTFCATGGFGQSYLDRYQAHYDTATLYRCNTANTPYFSDLEKEIVLLHNLTRINPALFADIIVYPFLKERNINTSYSRSLITDLKKTDPLLVMQHNKTLQDIAINYADEGGRKGWVGHRNFQRRYERILNEFSTVGENIEYGRSTALEIYMGLLIDEGIKDLGHRKNILNPEFNSIGIKNQKHSKFSIHTVINYGAKNLN